MGESESRKVSFLNVPFDVSMAIANQVLSWGDVKKIRVRSFRQRRIPGQEGKEAEGRR